MSTLAILCRGVHSRDVRSRVFSRPSSTSYRLDVPPVRLSTIGKQTFPVSGATVWNDLPLHVASAPSLAVFLDNDCFLVPTKTLLYHMTRVFIHYYFQDSLALALAIFNII